MILIEKPKLKFLTAGRLVTTETDRECRKGHVYAAGSQHGKRVCYVEVVEMERISRRLGYVLTIRLAPEPDRFLARDPGAQRTDYVLNPAAAARGEPPALDAATTARYSAEGVAAHARRKVLEFRRRHVRSATIRLREAERREDWDAYRKALQDLQAIERMVA